ncbi:MAG: LacI family transcriptional regulator [Ornithinibacter sp.]|nr:LacI family transcriptional regulator [Ornithinibacter sp.]
MRVSGNGVTIYSVAERAGVSIATVSRVLQDSGVVSERARRQVLEAVEELDYVPSGAARSLAVRQHDTYGLLLPELSGPYYSELLVGFETRAGELGRGVMLLLGGARDLAKPFSTLASRVDAICVFGGLAAHIGRSTRPVVVVAGGAPPGVEAITAENVDSAHELTDHLLAHGRTRLLFVGDTTAAPDVLERYEGFTQAHEDRGLRAAEPVHVEFRERDGIVVAERLLAGDLAADGLVCCNDEVALAIMARLTDAGMDVPDDVAVVGWDDVMTARVRPGLTTVRQPVHQLGALAADRLHELVGGAPPRATRHVLPTELVIRGSCGCEEHADRPRRSHPQTYLSTPPPRK